MVTEEMPRHWYEDYERGRPGYPDRVVEVADLEPSARVLDLAAGTGNFTRQLTSKFADVIAVEPDPGMRRHFAAACPDVEVVDGSADQIPLATDSVDAIFVAQAFHCFETESALTEMARVLRPGGALVVTWNAANGSAVPDITAIEDLLAPIWPEDFGLPLDMMSGDWEPTAWDLPFVRTTYEAMREERLPNPQTVDQEQLISFFGSMGWVANLPDSERQALTESMRLLLTESEYVLPWQTRVQWTGSI